MPEKGRATADVLPSPDMAFCQLFRLALQLDGDCLYLGVVLNSIFAHLAAPARLLETAERQRRVVDVVAVDPASASLEIGRAHVCTPVTNAHLVCRLLLDKKNKRTTPHQ